MIRERLKGNPRNLVLRIASALVLGPLTLAAVYYGAPAYTALIILASTIGLFEWLRLVDKELPQPVKIFALCGLPLILLAGDYASTLIGLELLAVLTLMLGVLTLIAKRKAAGLVTLGLPYLGGGGLALLNIRAAPDDALMLSFYLLAVVWGTDIGGYVAGRLIGGPKLAPRISPGKTWSGLFGGMALAAGAGYAVVLASDGRDPLPAALTALLLAPVAQIGDLFKSFFKRRAGVKDSGRAIPGHGGVLDRIDGLITASIVFALIRAACLPCTNWW